MGELCRQFRRELSSGETPLPVAIVQAWSIHAGLSAQAKHVLQRDNTKIGDGTLRRPNKCPMNPVYSLAEIAFRVAPFMLRRPSLEPSCGGVVVVGSRVDNLAGSAVRQIHMSAFVAETKLQHRHSRNLQPFPQ